MADANGFIARYPEFADVPTASISAALGDAARFVDDTWFPQDRDRGIYALAAHMLASEGALNGTDAAGGGGATAFGAVTSYKLGDASEGYGSWGGSGGGGVSDGYDHLKTTVYGVQYLRILRANVPAVAVV